MSMPQSTGNGPQRVEELSRVGDAENEACSLVSLLGPLTEVRVGRLKVKVVSSVLLPRVNGRMYRISSKEQHAKVWRV